MNKIIVLAFSHLAFLGVGLYLERRYASRQTDEFRCQIRKTALQGCEEVAMSVNEQLFSCERGIVYWKNKTDECWQKDKDKE